MNLNIYPVRMNNSYMNVRKESEPQKPVDNAPAFQGNIRKPLLALAAGALIGAGVVSCSNNNDKPQKVTVPAWMQTTQKPAKKISTYPVAPLEEANNIYAEAQSNNLPLGTTEYPDGTKIIVENIKNDGVNFKIITTKPDGTKIERFEQKEIETGRLYGYDETTYWPNGKVKEFKQYCYPQRGIYSDYDDEKEVLYERYNEKGQLLYWFDSLLAGSDHSTQKCDKFDRIIEVNDSHGHYKYEYPNDTTSVPCKETVSYNGCKRIREGKDIDFEVDKEYFIAKDGTKTDASVLNEIKW